MMKDKVKILGLFVLLVMSSCGGTNVPKPRGYFRIDIPEAAYQTLAMSREAGAMRETPYSFEYSAYAVAVPRQEPGERYWVDIVYPQYNAQIHCSYKPVKGQLRMLSDDAQDFVYKHAGKATAIPEQGFVNEEERIFGVYYELQGNTASPVQFYLTDSTRHFFRGALYFNCAPNQDSLAPVIDFIREDVRHMMETFEWTKE